MKYDELITFLQQTLKHEEGLLEGIVKINDREIPRAETQGRIDALLIHIARLQETNE
ncbi:MULTISPECIES: hypothetical protein [unclassified Rhizobium]|uniref:hypothetical protein n=1 Tax=unclassified Rhizobium TaxID=2613769 RepID=UPI001AD969A7|nr:MULTISPECIES: hypothetical protein [unclassified Rhizobium]MBO9102312.1 hypothetical protein [Rhizobium sp. L58/93]MBO9169957.1 hypothetical protein [Rhizobium sp. L245/93]MBO9188148.1 hypothetical protein [Rhizobium sp. E27B/91]QXZ82835.1 hypothetical protein J5287_12180 [Rhizobium sp. K1/93]QXZ89652.1 hypothetical protein J5280_16410 [Rhizobium sp. K15/93]